nr:hypothetical protein CFP56_28561 [Quercus suber]
MSCQIQGLECKDTGHETIVRMLLASRGAPAEVSALPRAYGILSEVKVKVSTTQPFMANSSPWYTSCPDTSAVPALETAIHPRDDWTSRSLQPSHVTPNLSPLQLHLYNAQSGRASTPSWDLATPQLGQPMPSADPFQTQQGPYDQGFGAVDFSLEDIRANNSLFELQLQEHQHQRQHAWASHDHVSNTLSFMTHDSTNYELPLNIQVTSAHQQSTQFATRNNASLQPPLSSAKYAVGRPAVHHQSSHTHVDTRRRSSLLQQSLEFGDRFYPKAPDLHAPKPQRCVPISAVIGMPSPRINVTVKGLESTEFDPFVRPSQSGGEEYIHRQRYIEQEGQEQQMQRFLQQPQLRAQRRSSRAKTQDYSTSVPATSKISSLALAHIYPHIDSPSHLNPFISHNRSLDDIPTKQDIKQSLRYIPRSGMDDKDETQLPLGVARTLMRGPASNAALTITASRQDSNTVVPAAEMLKSTAVSAIEHGKSGELYLSRSKDMIRRTSGGDDKSSKPFDEKVTDDGVDRYRGSPTAGPNSPPSGSSPAQAQSRSLNTGISDGECLGRTDSARAQMHTGHLLSANMSACESTKYDSDVHNDGTLQLVTRKPMGSEHHLPGSPLPGSMASSTADSNSSLSPWEEGPISQPQAVCRSQISLQSPQNSQESVPTLTPAEALPSVSPTSEQGKRPATPFTDPLPRPFKQSKVYPWTRGAQSKTAQTKVPRPRGPHHTCTKSPSTQTTPGRLERSTKYPRLRDSDPIRSPGSPSSLQQLATPEERYIVPLAPTGQAPTTFTESSQRFPCGPPQALSPAAVDMPRSDRTVKLPFIPIMPIPSNQSMPSNYQSWRPSVQQHCPTTTQPGFVYHHHRLPISPEVQARRQAPQPFQPAYDNMPPPFHPVQRPHILEGRTDNHANRLLDALAKKARIEGELRGEEWASIPPQLEPEYHYGETEAACPTCSRSEIWSDELRRARHDRYVGKTATDGK